MQTQREYWVEKMNGPEAGQLLLVSETRKIFETWALPAKETTIRLEWGGNSREFPNAAVYSDSVQAPRNGNLPSGMTLGYFGHVIQITADFEALGVPKGVTINIVLLSATKGSAAIHMTLQLRPLSL